MKLFSIDEHEEIIFPEPGIRLIFNQDIFEEVLPSNISTLRSLKAKEDNT